MHRAPRRGTPPRSARAPARPPPPARSSPARREHQPVKRTSASAARSRSRGSSGPSPATTSGTSRPRRCDRGVESLLLDQPPERQRVRSLVRPATRAKPGRARSSAALAVRSAGSPSRAAEPPVALLSTTNRSACANRLRLLTVQADRVHGRLAAATPGSQAQARAACRGRGSGSMAHRRGRRSRSRRTAGSCEGEARFGRRRARRRQRAPAEQRMQVVAWTIVRARRAPRRRPHPARAPRRAAPARPVIRPSPTLERSSTSTLWPRAAQQRRDVADRSLLAALGAVAVVQQQHAHRAHAIVPTSGSDGDRAAHAHYSRPLPDAAVRAPRATARRRGALLRRRRALRPAVVRRPRRPARARRRSRRGGSTAPARRSPSAAATTP